MQIIGKKIIHLKTVDSTNDFAAALIKKLKEIEGTVVITDEQLSGRGRGQNYWTSAKGKNILASIILYPDFLEVENQFYLSKSIALGISDFLSNYSSEVYIKWPNDIYIGTQKICGTLIEQTVSGKNIDSSVIGIGLNLNQVRFNRNLTNPVSLKKLTGITYNLQECLSGLLQNIDFRYQQLCMRDFKSIDTAYTQNLFRICEEAKYRTGKKTFVAVLKGVNKFGQLILIDKEKKEMHFSMDEIEFVIC